MSIPNTKYRIQCIVDYEYHDDTYDTIKELLDEWGDGLRLTRGKVATILKRQSLFNKYPHILISRIVSIDT